MPPSCKYRPIFTRRPESLPSRSPPQNIAAALPAAVCADRVSRRFGRVKAVSDVSFEVPKGSVVGVLGPNGAGKTTTIRMVCGVLPPSSGRVTVEGLDSIERSRCIRRRIGYLPESNPLYPEMTVREYLHFRGRVFGLVGRARSRRIGGVVDQCRLSDMTHRRIGHMSKGYRQRVGLAAALLHAPPILVLDEPTSGLDPVQIAETRALIRELAGEHTMMLVSHILPEVERTCDRVMVFLGGELRADGAPARLLDEAAGPPAFTLDVLGRGHDPGAVVSRLGAAPGVMRVEVLDSMPDRASFSVTGSARSEDLGAAIGRLANAEGWAVARLERRRATLESLYHRLVGGAEPAPANETDGPARGVPSC